MRYILLLLISILVLVAACDNEIVDNAADFEFETIDKDAQRIDLIVTIRYRLKSKVEKRLTRKYGGRYKDILLRPTTSSISRKLLQAYSAAEIYSYKRSEIEQTLKQQTKISLANYDVELTDFLVRSVGLSDTLMRRLEREHIEEISKEKQDNR